ncbi:MAG: aldose epimerase family protein [Egibacteraceae bacterium]
MIGTAQGHTGQGPTSVEAYTLDTDADLAITVWTYGATLVEVLVPDRDGRIGNVALRLPDLASYQDRARDAYVGATIGRFCRGVAGGRFQLNGTEHALDRNEGTHHFHGGSIGFNRYVWAAEAETSDDRLSLHLRLDSPDGDQGYPGAVSVTAVYTVDRQGHLTFEYTASTTASTILGLTNHAFWNMAGAGTVNNHLLALNATRVVTFDDELIPVHGPPRTVTGTRLDYSRPRRLAEERLDNFFVLDDPNWAAQLADPATGRVMRVTTDQPGIGVYSADHYFLPRAGLCLETGAWPDAPNRRDFPSARLDPGQRYRHRTTHEFSIHRR